MVTPSTNRNPEHFLGVATPTHCCSQNHCNSFLAMSQEFDHSIAELVPSLYCLSSGLGGCSTYLLAPRFSWTQGFFLSICLFLLSFSSRVLQVGQACPLGLRLPGGHLDCIASEARSSGLCRTLFATTPTQPDSDVDTVLLGVLERSSQHYFSASASAPAWLKQ